MYRISDSNQYLVKTGTFIKDIKISKKGWVLPGQRSQFFDITPENYTLQLQAMTAEKLEFNLPAVFTIGPKDDENSLIKYAKLLSSKDNNSEHVKDLVRGIIEGETRVIVAAMTMEEIFQERRGFKDKVIKNVQTELEQSKIESDTVLIENERKISIAKAEMSLATKKSEYSQVKIAAIEADQAAKMRQAELEKEVKERRLLSETERLRVQHVAKATAEYEAAKAVANAKLYAAQKEAEAALYKKQKEAEGILALYNSQAEGIKNLMQAFGGDGQAAIQYLMIEKENAQTIQGFNPKITVWNTGDNADPTANIFQSIYCGLEIDNINDWE
ncbi:25275_t:CDS:2 [Gigaspora margarita]|uniref:25275_t:CDS:1 n=1 Tax=Gigaspora margarita TaxID=4874 RepID=A0ABN7UF30_GIGMA|nr:25275_t:CDS:2 [Gigaspora margarita]